ncbi:MAG: 3-oxoacyl-[acyl-carrier-protein] reductase [Alphaproteobacteria bacterium GM202ARS2]|nr:3-oxoacyl-[acyl-carrier-protein] reductase [Alphaproteobacteria bacterium GM202ARS2]
MTAAFSLDGKRALITGASGGIGRALAHHLHQHGATVALSGRNNDALTALANELKQRTHVIVADLADANAPEALSQQATAEMGGIDILINNAGLTRDQLLLRLKEQDWDDVLNVDLSASFRLCRHVVPLMVKNRWGRIISISSVVARMGNPGQTAYCAAKGGLEGFSRALAHEVAARNITVNCIAPGFIDTPMTSGLAEPLKEKMLGAIPCRRFGHPDDIAATAVFLASASAAYITGQTIHVNGGMIMP